MLRVMTLFSCNSEFHSQKPGVKKKRNGISFSYKQPEFPLMSENRSLPIKINLVPSGFFLASIGLKFNQIQACLLPLNPFLSPKMVQTWGFRWKECFVLSQCPKVVSYSLMGCQIFATHRMLFSVSAAPTTKTPRFSLCSWSPCLCRPLCVLCLPNAWNFQV